MTFKSVQRNGKALTSEVLGVVKSRSIMMMIIRLLFGGSMRFSQAQKPLPAATLGWLATRTSRHIIIFATRKELFSQRTHRLLLTAVLERQQPPLREELIGTHHGMIRHRELKVGRDRRRGRRMKIGHVVDETRMRFHEVIRKRDSGTHVTNHIIVVGGEGVLVIIVVVVHDRRR